MGGARLGRLYADDAILPLPRHCYHTAMLILPRRRYRAADATHLLPLPHCRCGHTAAATLRLVLHCPAPANATPTATVPADDTPAAAASPAAIPTATATPQHRTAAPLSHSATA